MREVTQGPCASIRVKPLAGPGLAHSAASSGFLLPSHSPSTPPRRWMLHVHTRCCPWAVVKLDVNSTISSN
ncbi:hypothetical protein LR48_Vigan10g179300 [Vigna angularis]|uniref:Uncharacterized protein n=1 Tax=Phaseolus angularis TaxID=3914 RepID=A0A0L9VLG0_PHAAN|nr:hypothetical protein LR48_Vigan10g179300 [Vigna angularis]